MDHTNIINADEVARAMAAASQGKGKGKGRKKTTGVHASSPPKPKKSATTPTTRARSKTPASSSAPTTPASTQASAPRFYEANGLKIPLYNQNGLGNKMRPNARLSKTLLKYNTDELLDIVGQYAGADKRQELKNKGLSKLRLANWIEEKETLALGRNPRSELSFADYEEQAESSDDVASFLAPTIATSSGPNTKKHTATTPASNNQEDGSPTAAKGKSTSDHISGRKRSAPDMSSEVQPPTKSRKRDELANLDATNTKHSAKELFIDMSVTDLIPTPSQTDAQAVVCNDRDYDVHRQNAFFRSTGMDPNDPDRSSMIFRVESEDCILTATSHETSRGPMTYLYETTIPHNRTTEPLEAPPVPYLKKGIHGRNGDFQSDPERLTGLGHQIKPNDQLNWDEYKNFRAMLYQQFPRYPNPTSNGVAVDKETKDAWEQWQRWYGNFTEKYPGYAVSHFWPCGCEVVRDEEDNESEEE